MANRKLTELPEAESLKAEDSLYVVQDGISKKLAGSQIATGDGGGGAPDLVYTMYYGKTNSGQTTQAVNEQQFEAIKNAIKLVLGFPSHVNVHKFENLHLSFSTSTYFEKPKLDTESIYPWWAYPKALAERYNNFVQSNWIVGNFANLIETFDVEKDGIDYTVKLWRQRIPRSETLPNYWRVQVQWGNKTEFIAI